MSLTELTLRPFTSDDTPRVLVWAAEDGFVSRDIQNRADKAIPLVKKFIASPGAMVAIEPSQEFKKVAKITLVGAIGAFDEQSGSVYLDSSYANNQTVREATSRLRKVRPASTPG